MDPTTSIPTEIFWKEDSFRFLKPEDLESHGIDPADIPAGTFPALKHPAQLQSRFGGNAYGFGLFEVYDRLNAEDIRLLQSIDFDNPETIKHHYQVLNRIYREIGLLIRFSSSGRPYYLVPIHLVSSTLSHIKFKVQEITDVVRFHRKKFFKEHHKIGLVTHQDDLITRELALGLKDHRLVVLDSLEKLETLNHTLDLVVLTRDPYEIIQMERFVSFSQRALSKRELDQYAMYMFWRLYNLLKPDGELYIIAEHHDPKTQQNTKVNFKTSHEQKSFALFSHIFKTQKKYKLQGRRALQVNIFDFQAYLSSLYVEQEAMDKILGGKRLEAMTLEQINDLPYLNYPLPSWPFSVSQKTIWTQLLSTYFNDIFLKPFVPRPVSKEWKGRFTLTQFTPSYMMVYLGEKKPLRTTAAEVRREVTESRLIGCPEPLLAEYRNSFEFLIDTLRVLERLKKGTYQGLPQVFIDRLKQPLESRKRRFKAIQHVLKLLSKIKRLERVRGYLNPNQIEGPRTRLLENLEALTFFGFEHDELKEIVYIALGHTSLGRIISGKMNEKTLKPLSDVARTHDPQQALNLLRYCLLMTMAETEAARGAVLSPEQLAELFDLYESVVRVVTNRDLDWDALLDEKISSLGGIHNKIIRKLLKMINHFEFLSDWSELSQKGQMEKESLADYDATKLSRIENVITLVSSIDRFEDLFLQSDPLQLPAFYRKFLDMEFHGTGHIFERMDSEMVVVLLWIAVHVARTEVLNFNPILADVEPASVDGRAKKVDEEARAINVRYLDHGILQQLSEQLYQNGASFIVGTGFQLKVDPATKAVDVTYIDMDRSLQRLEDMAKRLAGCLISEIPEEEIDRLEILFSDMESFYQSHLRLLHDTDGEIKLPSRQTQWFAKAQHLREYLRSNFLNVIFHPEQVYTDLDLLYRHAPSLLNFILPELMALEGLDLSSHLYLNSPVTHYIITATRKLQALIRHEREDFQDVQFLHRLAQREFGPLATGIVGVSESQMQELELILDGLAANPPLMEALVKSFIFQDLGRIPALREKFKDELDPANLANASAFLVFREGIAERYYIDDREQDHLIFLIKHHSLLHHVVRGEFSFAAIHEILDVEDMALFNAFFIFSFIMLSAIRDDLILEDLADQLFNIKALCENAIKGEATLKDHMGKAFALRGDLFYALQTYQKEGLPQGVSPSEYLDSKGWGTIKKANRIRAGRMIFSLERIFRLRGIRYAEFADLVKLMLKVPLKFIHKQRKFSNIGYATFEKEVYEAFRIYNTLQNLREETRHFLLNRLVDDEVRVFGYEKVSGYLSYENQIKLLLIGLLGARKFRSGSRPIRLNYLDMCGDINRRYEAVNDFLNTLVIDQLWENKKLLNRLFDAKTGLRLHKEEFPNTLTIEFQDRVNISQKISYMATINDVEQLKNYFHYSLRSLRKYPFQTDDYEIQLEHGFEKRLEEITDSIVDQVNRQMHLISDFEELHNLINDLLARSMEIGFTEDQKHRLNDLYELRKDSLKREKLSEIDSFLKTIHDHGELTDYWNSIKWYLQRNRRFVGKEFELLTAKKFDEWKTIGNRA
jgi:hypothetical protein